MPRPLYETDSPQASESPTLLPLARLLGGLDQLETASRALQRLGGVGRLLDASQARLAACGLDPGQVGRIVAARELFVAAATERPKLQRVGRREVVELLRPLLRSLPHEELYAVYLTSDSRLLGHERLARGGATAVSLHIRDVLAPALEARASRLVLAHNHPSGNALPSLEDFQLTSRLAEAAELVGIRLVDHLVLAQDSVASAMPEEAARGWTRLGPSEGL